MNILIHLSLVSILNLRCISAELKFNEKMNSEELYCKASTLEKFLIQYKNCDKSSAQYHSTSTNICYVPCSAEYDKERTLYSTCVTKTCGISHVQDFLSQQLYASVELRVHNLLQKYKDIEPVIAVDVDR